MVDAARIRRPTDKPRVERMVQFVRGSFFAGESFPGGLAQAQRAAEAWCAGRAGQRIHRTTRRRPAEAFAAEEAPRLAPAPVFPYEIPVYASPKVHRDHHLLTEHPGVSSQFSDAARGGGLKVRGRERRQGGTA